MKIKSEFLRKEMAQESRPQFDAKWSVLTNPEKRNFWEDSESFATGEHEVGQLILMLQGLGYPELFKNALDFGCGVGRLTLPPSHRFQSTWGSAT